MLMSGNSGATLTHGALAAGVSELLAKPLQSREMAAALARVLGAINAVESMKHGHGPPEDSDDNLCVPPSGRA